MNVLFASILCSEQKLKWIFEQSKVKPAYATQKFSRLICRGLDANSVNVETISSIPVNRGMISKMFVNFNSEIEDNVKYNYCPVLNMLPGIKNLIVFVYSFVFTFCWCLRHKDKSVICDILQVSNCVGALLASKLTRTTVAAIVTDMPGFSICEKHQLSDTVSALGRFPIDLMPSFFKQADVMLLALKDDYIFSLTAPAKLQAYMAAAKPVVAMIDGEARNLIADSNCGVSSPAKDYQGLAENILKLSKMNGDDLRAYGENGWNYYRKYFTKEKCIDNLCAMLADGNSN